MISSKRGVLAAKGFKAATASIGIKKAGRKDMALLVSGQPCRAAGIFTVNQLAAAPVELSRKHLAASQTQRAILFNSGSANACTGQPGLEDAGLLCRGVAESLGCKPAEVLIASTGVIG
jgi:glutamate N-acetyltransferase/amino-acid N-acetyltransferase